MTIKERLDYLRGEIEAGGISYGEIAELQSMAEHIDEGDTVLLEWAGVPEGMKLHTLTRTGLAPLRFRGEVLACAEGKNEKRNRWYELTVYRTATGSLVLDVLLCSTWQGESDHQQAIICADGPELVAALADIDPLEYLGGYPDRAEFASRQARLERGMRRQWGELVSELLTDPALVEMTAETI